MGRANPIDAHVGSRLRQRRSFLGLSQEKLARSLDLTFQQIQKYERGANRISAGRLYQLASALDVPVGYFFSGLDQADGEADSRMRGQTADVLPKVLHESASTYDGDVLSSRETLDLVRAYYRLPSRKLRRRVLDMLRAIEADATVRHVPKSEPSPVADGIAVMPRRRGRG